MAGKKNTGIKGIIGWIDDRLPIFTLMDEYVGPAYQAPRNLNYWWNFGSIAAWRGNGKSFSSGRDTTELGVRTEDISDLDFIERGHLGAQQFFTMPCPITSG